MKSFGWYVVQSQPRKEGFVRERIMDLDREVFLPLVTGRGRSRHHTRVGPLFPGYLFARLCVEAGDLAVVRWTHGVRRLLGDREHPRPVADTIVEGIRRRADRGGKMTSGLGLERGSHVKIMDGPLRGLSGILDRPGSSPEERVCVLLDLFHRCVRAEVPLRAMRPGRA